MRLPPLAFIVGFLALAASPASAQNVSVDEGTFRIYKNGEPAGEEDFSIRRIGRSGQERLILRGTVDTRIPEGQVTLEIGRASCRERVCNRV